MSPEGKRGLEAALEYRDVYGLNPLPSRRDRKNPVFPYAAYWEEPAPAWWFTEDGWPDTPNIQVVCGRRWDLFVIDLDGPEAQSRWRDMGDPVRTWVSHREGGHSRHHWFRIPGWFRGPIRKGFVWRGEEKAVAEGEHERDAIEVLGEKSLVVAPPSRHVVTGGHYRFINEDHSPLAGSPAVAPRWIMDLIPKQAERPRLPAIRPRPRKIVLDGEMLPSRGEILGRIHDKIGLARSWGVRVTGRVSPTGWAECHAIDRPDDKPSAAIHRETGIYTDRGSGVSMSLFDLQVATGHAHDFDDARARLARLI